MKAPEKVNGKEIQQQILKAISTLNIFMSALEHWNPSTKTPIEAIHAEAATAANFLLMRELCTLAQSFNINAEISIKEHKILADGKLVRFPDYHSLDGTT